MGIYALGLWLQPAIARWAGIALLIGMASVPALAEDAPVQLQVQTGKIEAAIKRAPWIALKDAAAKPNGKVIYFISFRTCPNCEAFKATEFPPLLAAGVEVRAIVYARRDQGGMSRSKPVERALAAELWETKNLKLLKDWWAAEDLDAFYAEKVRTIESADINPVRRAAVASGRDLVDRLAGYYSDNGVGLAIPVLIWQEKGTWKTYVGYDEAGFAPARAFLTTR